MPTELKIKPKGTVLVLINKTSTPFTALTGVFRPVGNGEDVMSKAKESHRPRRNPGCLSHARTPGVSPRIRFVEHLPDLITPEDYQDSPDKKKIRIRITLTDEGVEILGDSAYVNLLDELLAKLDPKEIEKTLCG